MTGDNENFVGARDDDNYDNSSDEEEGAVDGVHVKKDAVGGECDTGNRHGELSPEEAPLCMRNLRAELQRFRPDIAQTALTITHKPCKLPIQCNRQNWRKISTVRRQSFRLWRTAALIKPA